MGDFFYEMLIVLIFLLALPPQIVLFIRQSPGEGGNQLY
jgi:hypothetical protein